MRDMNEEQMIITELLQNEGIKAKGYGIISRYFMKDDISHDAKSIYAYLCSYAGGGTTALTDRKTILYHMGISKDRYYRALNALIEDGYITIKQVREEGRKFSKNIYTIATIPKKFLKQPSKDVEAYTVIRNQGLEALGYGMISKIPMQDRRIHIISKSVYAYLCALAGAGNQTLQARDLLLQELNLSEKTYLKYLRQLLKCDYISRVQTKGEKGEFSINKYCINMFPNKQNKSALESKALDSEMKDAK